MTDAAHQTSGPRGSTGAALTVSVCVLVALVLACTSPDQTAGRTPGTTSSSATAPTPADAAATGSGPPAPAAVFAPVGSTGEHLVTVGRDGWQVASSADVAEPGSAVSRPGFATTSWIPVTPDDAGAPGTEIGALLQHGECPDVMRSDHLTTCFGQQLEHGPVTTARFAVPWWFRTQFDAALDPGAHVDLVVNGVVGEADVWVNGTQVAPHTTVRGAYARYDVDITSLVRPGPNAIAFAVHPNDPMSMFTIDDIDWNQIPPDNKTGIQFPVQLHVSGAVALGDSHVNQVNSSDLERSDLSVLTTATNRDPTPVRATVEARIDPPGQGSTPIEVSTQVDLAPGESRPIRLDAATFPALHLDHPAVWWPYQLGDHPIYALSVTARATTEPDPEPAIEPATGSSAGTVVNGTTDPMVGASDATASTFGIRTVDTYLTAPTPLAPSGLRGFAINGRRLLVRGAGWAPDIFLRYSARDTADQLALLTTIGLNAVRTEGHDMPEDFYTQMDRSGVLVLGGFQCCVDSWAPGFTDEQVTDDGLHMMDLSARALGQRLRNHPSVMSYQWSDINPTPKQEDVILKAFAAVDFEQPIISSALYRSSAQLGPAGEKEGPYDYVPPVYWYDDQHGMSGGHDDSEVFANVGGAWGFNSEVSAGHTIPTRDSLDRFLTPAEQTALWTDPGAPQFHTNAVPGVGNFKFGTLTNLAEAMRQRYGQWPDLDRFILTGQVTNYETVRAQFEAAIAHVDNQPNPATGMIYWQLSKGWPSLLWTLYNNDYDVAGAYFGAAKANEDVHALFDEGTRQVAIANLTNQDQRDLTLRVVVHGLDGTVLDDQTVPGLALGPLEVQRAVAVPHLPTATSPPEPAVVSFVELELDQGGRPRSRNVYWISSQADVVDWTQTTTKSYATMQQWADLRALANLPPATVSATATTAPDPDDPSRSVTSVSITNTSSATTVGFFIRADVRRGHDGTADPGDSAVLPVLWSDNDVTLWPGQSATLRASYRTADRRGAAPVLSISGWNVAPLTVGAPGS